LIEALKAECDRFSKTCSIRLDVNPEGIPDKLPREVALCLFRIAQEALRNIARHAGARRVEVRLQLANGGPQTFPPPQKKLSPQNPNPPTPMAKPPAETS